MDRLGRYSPSILLALLLLTLGPLFDGAAPGFAEEPTVDLEAEAPVSDPDSDLPQDLPPRFREWLAEVEMLMTEEEREYFLNLKEDFRRDAFTKAFWKQRDSYDDTAFNEFRVHYQDRSAEALSLYGSLEDARAMMYVEQGEPYDKCWHKDKEVEIWTYDEARRESRIKSYDSLYPVLLFRPSWSEHYLRWLPLSATSKNHENVASPGRFEPASRKRLPDVGPRYWCEDGHVGGAMARMSARAYERKHADPETFATLPLPEPSKEWVAAFHASTTLLPEDAEIMPASLSFAFPGAHQQRTVVQGLIELKTTDVGAFVGDGDEGNETVLTENALAGEEGAVGHHQLLVLGEIVRGDELFENFRYRFELPAEPGAESLGMVFQRYLRPGTFRMLLKIEDLYGRRYAHVDTVVEVPDAGETAKPELLELLRKDSPLYRALVEADAATARGEHTLQLLPPPGVVVTGMVRLQTITAGDFERVVFLMDGQPILAKKAPPYSVELDMGEVPSAHRVRVNGYGVDGSILATDEILLNPGGQRFRVALTEPQKGRRYEKSLRAAVQVAVPDGEELDRIELYLNETRIATLYQPPFIQPVLLSGEELAYVRAVGYLKDGNTSEDMVFVNAPGEIDEIDVQFVELYAAVYDRQGRFIPDLTEGNFRVLEDGKPQQARRFEQVDNLPLHVAMAIDVSASMEDSIDQVSEAAQTFIEEVVQPRDRASVIAFNHQPNVRARFTNEVESLNSELEALRASGGTALYDSLAFALHYFHGIRGQRALLLLSDGEDESSGFSYDDALEFARRAGVQIYVIGLKEAITKSGARKVLKQFAKETGGRSFFVEDLSELSGIYAEIQAELRSQYLFAYQSTSGKDPSEFRSVQVQVQVEGKKADVRTMSGYYP